MSSDNTPEYVVGLFSIISFGGTWINLSRVQAVYKHPLAVELVFKPDDRGFHDRMEEEFKTDEECQERFERVLKRWMSV